VLVRLPKIARASGSWLYDAEGRAWLDGSSGPAVFCIGHAHPEVNAAIKAQLDQVAHGYRFTFTSDPLEEMTEIIDNLTGGGFRHMSFVSGGSEATEACLKMALQYQHANGEPTRKRFISRQRSWHGTTLGALSVSGFAARRGPFEGSLLDVSMLSQVNAYRPPPGVEAKDVATFCANELEQEILRLGPERVAAFIFEPVVGAAGGAVPAPPGYAGRIREICSRYGVVMIADEVMCGAGRCGTWRALAHDGVQPDIMAVAKGLGGGYLPLGAALFSDDIAETVRAAHGAPLTGHTFTGHTTALAAGVAVQKIVSRERLVERVASLGPVLEGMLASRLQSLPQVGDIRGRGFFWGIELVRDPDTREPFDPSFQVFARVRDAAFERGLICYPTGGNVDGRRGDHVIVAPPFNVSESELDQIVSRLGDAIEAVLEALPR
jgi:adenosylmethionine-8-amino-7-oxononanoate aminotransferase